MASRFHWLNGGADTGWFNGTPPNQTVNITIPANATLKKFLVRHVTINFVGTGTGYNTIQPWAVTILVTITSGVNINKVLFDGSFRIPCSATALYDPLTGQRIYSIYHNVGDKDIGVNQQVSWGKLGEPAFNVRGVLQFDSRISGFVTNPTYGQLVWNFACLYYL